MAGAKHGIPGIGCIAAADIDYSLALQALQYPGSGLALEKYLAVMVKGAGGVHHVNTTTLR